MSYLKDFNWGTQEYKNSPILKTIPFKPTPEQITNIKFRCEGLRDGLGLVNIVPNVQKSMAYIDLVHRLGIRNMTVGIYPGEGGAMDKYIQKILKELNNNYPEITPLVLCLTMDKSIDWVLKCKEVNPRLEALLFIGTSPSRMIAEDWDIKFVLDEIKKAFTRARKEDLNIIGATEHTTQTPPQFLERILKTQVEAGQEKLKSFIIADTIGCGTPLSVYRLTNFVLKTLKDLKAKHVEVEFHGHNDLDNATANNLVAIAAGATYIHTVPRGYGERAGNTRLESVLLNLTRIADSNNIEHRWNLEYLDLLLRTYDKVLKIQSPQNGMMGLNAFRTGYGLHAAAMYKLSKKKDEAKREKKLKDVAAFQKMYATVYSAIDPESVGRNHEIVVGPHIGINGIQLAAKLLNIKINKKQAFEVKKLISYLNKPFTKEEFTDIIFTVENGSNGNSKIK